MKQAFCLTRRHFMSSTVFCGAGLALPGAVLAAPARAAASASWLDGSAPAHDTGQSFGLAWPQGALRPQTALAAHDASGAEIAVQSWITATWPDGSVKWTGHALPAGSAKGAVTIAPGRAARSDRPVSVERKGSGVIVRQGDVTWILPGSGDLVVASAARGGRNVIDGVRLRAILAADPRGNSRRNLAPSIRALVVEQSGPVRAVVRIEGQHSSTAPHLPFTLRLYFSASSDAVRIVHSFIHDGDPQKDFVAGLGLSVETALQGEAHDRHVRIGLSKGRLFSEAAKPLTGLRRDPGREFREAQIAGRATPSSEGMRGRVTDLLDAIPVWNDIRLTQHTANGFALQKRTGADHAWVDAEEGRRAPGFGSVSSPVGGAALSIRYFWERHPAALHVDGLASERTQLTGWLWSPDAEPMDMRSYRGVMGMEGYDAQNDGLEITYEDYEPGWDDARGIARTSEMTLWALGSTPDTGTLLHMAKCGAESPRLLADAASLSAAKVFGDWSLPDRSTPARAAIETQLANLVDFYAGEVDRRSWYGFWDHGDVMHTYDADRHQWRYDIGGFAWDNSELSTDLWLWMQALRTGNAATFRLAEAMTRHTGEVDVYHLGRFKGLGTRHGVQHFSDSSKQPRISTAVYRRIFYYLSADERTGDLMRDLLGSEERLADVVIQRKVPGYKPSELPPGTVDMSFGTVWSSLAANWLTEWERTGRRQWRDRLAAGMASIAAMPNGWLTGGAPYDLSSGVFQKVDKVSVSHLNAVFGAVEVNSELLQLIEMPSYRAAWLDYCRYYNAPEADFEARYGKAKMPFNLREGHSRLTAFAADRLENSSLSARAAEEFYSGAAGLGTLAHDPRLTLSDGTIEWPNLSTNAAAQWGLAAIQNLALIPEALDQAWQDGRKS